MEIKKLAINFGDNDYHRTFKSILDTIALSYLNNGSLDFTKEQITFIINELSYGMYLLHQNRFKYEVDDSSEYLTIIVEMVHINEEVDSLIDDITTKDNGNHQVFILDNKGHKPYVYSI